MSINTIERLVLKLNKKWFENKRVDFTNETFYNSDKDKIYDVLEELENTFDEEGNTIPETREITIDKDFNSYCWSYYYPGSIYDHEGIEHYPLDGKDVANDIIAAIDRYLTDIQDIERICKFIVASIETISSTIDKQTHGFKSEAYVNFLKYFLLEFRKSIAVSKYGRIKRVLDITSTQQEDKPKSVSDNPILSFKYNSDHFEDEIGDLFNSLKSKFIDDLTNKHKFKTVFAEKPIIDKVVWIGGISTLKYFIKKLVDNSKIDSNTDYWKITQACFTNNGKNLTTTQLKQAKYPAKEKAQRIDNLTSNL